ncbi:hypothetical protein [Flavisolibacter tropicus]|uniref:Transglutaminase-like domain-containing protein n=1 Tax=Flavisolibacter tropicus TaxID=1492898 RepID=A0A172TZA5_9BACT|nr:hypothetical protein [Flavisolibacter tropicus]ANE52431.1 hypothetical protein SY85_20045 [Flavisolibacter tropicus]
MKRRNLIVLFVALTAINLIIYYYRDYFHYQPYRDHSFLYKECNEDCEALWKTDFKTSHYKEQIEAKRSVASWLLDSSNSTLVKANQISKQIYDDFGKRYGHPKAYLLQLSPFNQYKALNTNTGDSLWCGIYAGMFSYFAWAQNIITRNIEMKYSDDSHVVSECYIPELKKWIVVDPTFGMLALKNEQGVWLDLQSFRNELRNNKTIYVLKSANGKLAFEPLHLNEHYLNHYYKPTNSTDLYYHHTSLQEAYKPVEKLKRYLLPVSWYYVYDAENKTNIRFGVKLVFIILWVLVIVLLLVTSYTFKSGN